MVTLKTAMTADGCAPIVHGELLVSEHRAESGPNGTPEPSQILPSVVLAALRLRDFPQRRRAHKRVPECNPAAGD